MCVHACMRGSVAQPSPTLCDPLDCSLPGSSVHGISQARVLEWVAIPFSRGSSRPRDGTPVSWVTCIARWILYHWATRKLYLLLCTWACLVAQLCLTLCDPMDCSPPDSSVHGIFPCRNTGMGCHSFLQGIFPTQGSNTCLLSLLHWQADSLSLNHLGSTYCVYKYGQKLWISDCTTCYNY